MKNCKHEWQLDDLGKHCKKCNYKDHVPIKDRII